MKKNQKKSKVEERKSVANQCDYSRMNGKCGRALCDNFGKPCPGRSCEDWKCDAEGEESKSEVVINNKVFTECNGVRKDGTCGNKYCEAFNQPCIGIKTCRHIFGYYTTENGGGYWQPNEGGHDWNRAVAVAGSNGQDARSTRAVSVRGGDVSPASYRERVSGQYAAIETAKDNLLRECVKFGALLLEVSYYLGETQGKKGEGLQAWLAENCPQINYNTAMGYKRMGEMAVTKIGGGSQAVAVLQDKTEVIPPGEDAPIEVESKFVEKRDELFKEVKSRRELEQTYFKFMASEGKGKPGRKKGTTKPVPENYAAAHKTQAENAATAYALVWKELDKKRQLPYLASLLPIDDARDILALVDPVYHALKKRVGEAEEM